MAKFVSKEDARYKSGPKKGKLRPGCRFLKNGAAMCGLGATKKKATPKRKRKAATKRKSSGTKGLGKFVSESEARRKGGPHKGTLKKGCRAISTKRGTRYICIPPEKRTPTKKKCCRYGVNKNTGKCLKHPRKK
jgi:hypothetical protein